MVGAVNHKLPVFLDGPMMRGTDMLKVLALGAQAVVIDHQLVWGFVHQVRNYYLITLFLTPYS